MPDNLRALIANDSPIRDEPWWIEKRDGSVLLLAYRHLFEFDPHGTVARQFENGIFQFQAGEVQNRRITLDGFAGKDMTLIEKRNQFWIWFSQVRSIEFR